MTSTARLDMPLIAAEQAQKHVTHNEALLLLDAAVQLRLTGRGVVEPPESPDPGQTFAIGTDATDAWQGRDGQLAHWTEGGWRYLQPQAGWLAWDETLAAPVIFDGSEWRALLSNLEGIGVGAIPDPVNRLAIRTEAALFTAIPDSEGGNGNLRLTLNKEAQPDSATLLFQSGWSGRAEIGLSDNDDFAFKVSPDGVTWLPAITLDHADGFVRLEQLFGAAVSFPVVQAGGLEVATSYAVPAPESGVADEIATISGGFDGAMLIITGSAGIALTFKDGTGNLKLGGDRVLSHFEDSLMLMARDRLDRARLRQQRLIALHLGRRTMPASRWTHCLAQILKHEGGYVDHPSDPGGATNMGITHKTLARWRGIEPWWALEKAAVRALEKAEASAIYKALYWERVNAGSLPPGVDLAMFDFAVNSGPDRAVRLLQALVGTTQDGFVGPVTLAAVARRDPRALVEALCDQRLNFLQRLTTFATFGRGWTNRVADIRATALADAAKASVPGQPQGVNDMTLFEGYKTYAIGLLMLLVGASQLVGIEIPQFGDYSSTQLIMEALAIIFLRKGIKSEIAKA